ncbi:MAG: class II fumarate hydratase, partial [Flavobacteriaceae bacterium]
AQIMGNDVTIGIGNTQGHFELNVFRPVIAKNILESSQILGDACKSFSENCISGITPNLKKIDKLLNNSLMLITALNTKIGYYKSAEIANLAFKENISLKEAGKKLNYVSEKDFDKWVIPEDMTGKDND